MVTVAIIDDALNEMYLTHTNIIQRYSLLSGHPEKTEHFEGKGYTHSTMCARVLEEYGTGYQVINIQIMENHGTPCSVQNLAAALQLCSELPVDIVHMSVGTPVLSESRILDEPVGNLARRNVLMTAALDNRGLVTLPAAYPQVIGVRCDRNGVLVPGSYVCHTNDPWGIQVTANYEFDTEQFPALAPSNSLAVPMIAAKLCKYRNQGIKKLGRILKALEKESAGAVPEGLISDDEDKEPELPVVAVVHKEAKDQEREDPKPIWYGSELMDAFHRIKGYEAAGLQLKPYSHDIRILTNKNTEGNGIRKSILFIERHTTADVVFLFLEGNELQKVLGQVVPDMVIHMEYGEAAIEKNGQDDFRIRMDKKEGTCQLCAEIEKRLT
ncbi:hypothetical protein [Anaerolentibacter hominis]|uniref:hypothetical protein n=1 Tax=Anaerolentibacter hominis TaxID=3079009 RepID=UPI0031B89AB8